MTKKPRKTITADQRKDWRNLTYGDWNVLTVQTMVTDLNAEKYGAEKYVPMRGYGFEQGRIKQALAEYGAEALAATIERAFAEYRPTAEYPQLTAGFLISYMLPRTMPQVLAEREAQKRRQAAESEAPDIDDVIAWL